MEQEGPGGKADAGELVPTIAAEIQKSLLDWKSFIKGVSERRTHAVKGLVQDGRVRSPMSGPCKERVDNMAEILSCHGLRVQVWENGPSTIILCKVREAYCANLSGE